MRLGGPGRDAVVTEPPPSDTKLSVCYCTTEVTLHVMQHVLSKSETSRRDMLDIYLPEDSPPIGAAKQQPTPTAQAAASISMFLDSFCNTHTYTHTYSPVSKIKN